MTGRRDRTLNIIVVITAVVTAGTLVLAAIALPVIFDSRATSEQAARSNDLIACRSTFAAAVNDATSDRLAAIDARDNLTSRALELLLRGDKEAALRVAAAGAVARARVDRASRRVAVATDRYVAAVRLSRTDPARFLARCRREGS